MIVYESMAWNESKDVNTIKKDVMIVVRDKVRFLFPALELDAVWG